jgi:hypothetical protein
MEKITISEAILKILEEEKSLLTGTEIYKKIADKKYYDFSKNSSPESTVHGLAGRFIRHGDTRIKRIKKEGTGYYYFLTKFESLINLDSFSVDKVSTPTDTKKKTDCKERGLHKLFITYLNSVDIYAKTIFHEKSNKDDETQKWTHPDIVGVEFLNLQNNISKNFLKAINVKETFKLYSYELKREITNDYELKKAYFQAVSNSSWANYGYLVAFEIDKRLDDEIKRLNESFGIGVLELFSNPYQTKILYQSKYRELDIKTIDKLCKNNSDFNILIGQLEKLLNADERYYKTTEEELKDICDKYFENDDEIRKYCIENNIPVENIEEDE